MKNQKCNYADENMAYVTLQSFLNFDITRHLIFALKFQQEFEFRYENRYYRYLDCGISDPLYLQAFVFSGVVNCKR